MRWKVVFYYLGLFLKIFSVLLLVPVMVGKLYGETFVGLEPFLFASFFAIIISWGCTHLGAPGRPKAVEAMVAATIGWLTAVGLGAIPIVILADIGILNAYFEAMSGFTTTGMTVLPSVTDLPYSLLFWRAFMQWIGGLGIITFFVAVLVESGGVANKLVAVESNKTDSGSIRASLFNAIKSMWYVYILLTVIETIFLAYFGFPTFHALTTALATLPTGGYSTVPNLGALLNPGAKATLIVFMFAGGTNFLLLYSLLSGNVRRMLEDYEFRLYIAIIFLPTALVFLNLIVETGAGSVDAFSTALFHTVSYVSSTGFELTPLRDFPVFTQGLIMFLMLVGASLGSTTGGIKLLRIGVMLKLVKQQIRAVNLPPTVMNPVSVHGRIIHDDEIRQIAAIVFVWLMVVMVGGLLMLWFAPFGIPESLQLFISAAGTMGPTLITQAELIALNPLVKIGVMIVMLAGRLEMLPVLALLNYRIIQKFS